MAVDDFNRDGIPDLAATSTSDPRVTVLLGRGDGTFEDVSEAAGVRVVEREGTDAAARPRPVAKALGVVLCDPDGDGWPDLMVANDNSATVTIHDYRFSDGCQVIAQESPRCCSMHPCAACSLCGALIAGTWPHLTPRAG